MDPLVANKLKVKVATTSVMEVRVANGKKICSVGACQEMVSIQRAKFMVPFHILPLGGCDVVPWYNGLKLWSLSNGTLTTSPCNAL